MAIVFVYQPHVFLHSFLKSVKLLKYQSLQVQAKTQNFNHFGGQNFRLSDRNFVFLA